MDAKEPKQRLATRKAIDSVASKFDLPNEDWMQDWPIEIAEKINIRKCLDGYENLNEDERFVAMEGILYAFDLCSDEEERNKLETEVKPLLEDDFHIHEYTIYYWTLYGEPDASGILRPTQMCRDVWSKKK